MRFHRNAGILLGYTFCMTRKNPYMQDHHAEAASRLQKSAARASVFVATVLICAKWHAYYMTGSVSLLSSLIDSILDSFSSLIMMIGVHQALQPADRKHRFGHGKFEALASMLQVVFITGSAVFLIYESLLHMAYSNHVHHIPTGIGVMVLSMALTLGLVGFQRHVIRKTGSLAISADSLHYQGDLLINLAVIIALLLSQLTAWPYFDPLFALAITVVLLHGAYKIGLPAINILTDKELPETDRRKISRIILGQEGVRAIHDLRTRSSGTHLFIEFHMEIDGHLNIKEAHEITEAVEMRLYRAFPSVQVIIHPEPFGMEDSRLDDRVA